MSLRDYAKQNGVTQFLVSFTDLCGVMRSKLVPASAIDGMEQEGAGFAGFAAYLNMSPADPDLFAIPDPSSVIQLPWKKNIAWVASDLVINGEPLPQGPRHVLRQQINAAKSKGYNLKTGVECEFFLLDADQHSISDAKDTQLKPCYDQQALMRYVDYISLLSEYMEQLGWGPYQADHEDGNGQFEMNWDYADCLVTADRHSFFKFMVRSLAEEVGLRATFMPKPFSGVTGNGCHIHFSLWNERDENIFHEESGELGLSETAYHFLGGVLHSAEEITAITNPTINSYKRTYSPVTSSGSTWSPNTVTYSGNNRTHMIRIPDSDRFENRAPDGATNPYLLPAAILATGLDGIEAKREPGKRFDNNSYEGMPSDVKKLPRNLDEALDKFSQSSVLENSLGTKFINCYRAQKQQELDAYAGHITDWEQKFYIES